VRVGGDARVRPSAGIRPDLDRLSATCFNLVVVGSQDGEPFRQGALPKSSESQPESDSGRGCPRLVMEVPYREDRIRMRQPNISSVTTIAMLVVPICSAKDPAIDTSPESGRWTPIADGLQFRVTTRELTLNQKDKLSVTIELRNAGKKDRAFLDPRRLPGPEASVAFYPCTLRNGKPFYFSAAYSLDPAWWRPTWFTVLKPGETIRGVLSFSHTVPEGRHMVYLAVIGRRLRGTVDSGTWGKQETETILPVLWNPDKDRVLVGPIDITVK